MVVALNELLSKEKALQELLNTFKCSLDSDEEDFLKNDAIKRERTKEARTFLYFDDNKVRNGQIEIDGFFSLAIKLFHFTTDENDFNVKKGKPFPAYLIGQLARADSSKKGLGKTLLNVAIRYIKAAELLVGGRLIYLDCKATMINYYEKYGFKYIQDRVKPDKNGNILKQLYLV